ncbi:MAG: hypothetical protein ACREJD_13360 [Phycisphaerales bacterium]
MNVVKVLVAGITIALAACSTSTDSAATSQSGADVLRSAASSEFGSPGYACSDTVAIAKECGVNYEQLVGNCLARSPGALHKFFQLSKNAGFDAASSEGNSEVTAILLRQLGDQVFGFELSRESGDVQQVVQSNLAYALGYEEITAEAASELHGDYPNTFPRSWKQSVAIVAIQPSS